MEGNDESKSILKTYSVPLVAGAIAGVSVDVALYPLDTLKTRLQSKQGFHKAGGFRGVYRGLLTVASTSMPTSALFFVSYEGTKKVATPLVTPQYVPFVHMLAASVGEVLACVIRVPTEIAKQRKQTYVGKQSMSSIQILVQAFRTEGFRNGVYRGFFSTVLRDLPFSFIELPLWEFLKTVLKERSDTGQISSFQSALCGSVAGGVAAAATTPLDLAKTRIMLAEGCDSRKLRIKPVLSEIYAVSGFKGLFAGVTPRFTGFLVGGFVFFGAYDGANSLIETYFR